MSTEAEERVAPASRWRGPLASIQLASVVLSLGRGAWFTCWALFFTHSLGLTASQFGIGITAAGVVGLFLGVPAGYLADRFGAKETLILLGVAEGLAILSYVVITGFLPIVLVTCIVIASERAIPGIRIALIAGLASESDRLSAISRNRAVAQVGVMVGAVLGGFILALNTHGAYLTMVLMFGIAELLCAALILRVPHVQTLRDRKVKRKMLVFKDRPFLLITLFSGILALNWGMIDSGVPLWIGSHAPAPLWIMGVLTVISALFTMLYQLKVSRKADTVAKAGRVGLRSGVFLAVSCVVFALSYHMSGIFAAAIMLVAMAPYMVGELTFVASGWGLSTALTTDEAHGEYQGMFATGQAAAMIIAPGVMALLLVNFAVAGWLALGALYLVAGAGTLMASKWALRAHPALATKRG